jgi:hypothetical protein
MPYIAKPDRPQYADILKQLPDLKTKGDLEFCLFYLLLKYMKNREYKYTQLHEAVYAAQHCADEFRRRFLDHREDTAILQNGDVQL